MPFPSWKNDNLPTIPKGEHGLFSVMNVTGCHILAEMVRNISFFVEKPSNLRICGKTIEFKKEP